MYLQSMWSQATKVGYNISDEGSNSITLQGVI